MLDLQDAMNLKVNPDWRAQKFEWYRAIWVECAEMLDHYGWKWWKKQDIDLPQVQLELVDIFHFGLSLRLMQISDHQQLADQLAEEVASSGNESDFKLALEQLASEALANKSFDVSAFADCLRLTNMSTDDLFKQYVGKNTLNFFRQDHGYQDGSYLKVWNGREDNEYLVDILNNTSADAENFQELVYSGLEAHYPK
jgi:dimeric dUTPase (all-alpha-NTP-PPase superfamily)